MATVEARERIVVASMRSASEFEVAIVHANIQWSLLAVLHCLVQ